MTSRSPESDLNLEAFRFVMGDMSEAERNRFEEQLALDVTLCQAVADMQLICSSTRAALAPCTTTVARKPAHPLHWWTVLATALVLVVAVSFWVGQSNHVGLVDVQSQKPLVAEADLGASTLILAAWTDLQPADPESSTDQMLESLAEHIEPASYEVPNWMLIAVDPQMEDRMGEVAPRREGTL